MKTKTNKIVMILTIIEKALKIVLECVLLLNLL
jgi:hypothetical protein